MIPEGLVDRVLAVAAMLAAIPPLLRGSLGSRSHLSWKRALALVVGGLTALAGAFGLLLIHATVLGGPLYLPTWTGGTLAFLGGGLGVATLIAGRGPAGLSEEAAIRYAALAVGMTLYVATPRAALVLLGSTRLLRGLLPVEPPRRRWWRVVEGAALMLLCLVPREATLGGLRVASAILGEL